MTIIFRIVCVLFALFSAITTAKAEMVLHLYELDDRLLPSGDRGYNYFLDDILKDYPEKIEKRYASITRTSVNFARDSGSCSFPANEQSMVAMAPEAGDKKLIFSKSVDAVSAYVYVPEGAVPPSTMWDLQGMRIGHVIGNIAAELIRDRGVNFYAAPTNENLMRMLKAKRIDAIIGFHPDLAIAFDTFDVHNLRYSTDLTLLKVTVKFLCHDTPETRAFIKYMDERIPIMARDGRTQNYLSPHAEVIQHDE